MNLSGIMNQIIDDDPPPSVIAEPRRWALPGIHGRMDAKVAASRAWELIQSQLAGGASIEEALALLLVTPAEYDWLKAGSHQFPYEHPAGWRLAAPELYRHAMLDVRNGIAKLQARLLPIKDLQKTWSQFRCHTQESGSARKDCATWEEVLGSVRSSPDEIAWLTSYPDDPESDALQSEREAAEIQWAKSISRAVEAEVASEKANRERNYGDKPEDRKNQAAWRRRNKSALVALAKRLKPFGIEAVVKASAGWNKDNFDIGLSACPKGFAMDLTHIGPADAKNSIQSLVDHLESGGPEAKAWVDKNLAGLAAAQLTPVEPLNPEEECRLIESGVYANEIYHRYWSFASKGELALVWTSSNVGGLVRSDEYPNLVMARFDRIKEGREPGCGNYFLPKFKTLDGKKDIPRAMCAVRAIDGRLASKLNEKIEEGVREVKAREAKLRADEEQRRLEAIANYVARRAICAAKAESVGITLEDFDKAVNALDQLRRSHRPGRCRVCDRLLTDRVSASEGIGPECRKTFIIAKEIEQSVAAWKESAPKFAFTDAALRLAIGDRFAGKVNLDKLKAKLLADGHTIEPS